MADEAKKIEDIPEEVIDEAKELVDDALDKLDPEFHEHPFYKKWGE